MCGGCEDCAAVDPAKPHIAWEYHATIVGTNWYTFKQYCDQHQIKAIRVENISQIPGGEKYDQSYMTSHKIVADSIGPALEEYYRVHDLIHDQFDVVRNKIGQAPWCPDVPKTPTDFVNLCRDGGDPGYFEVHFQINQDTAEIKQKLWKLGLALSCNIDKDNIIMATYRKSTWLKRFEMYVDNIKKNLKNLPVDNRVIIEYTIYDSYKEYDNVWYLGSY